MRNALWANPAVGLGANENAEGLVPAERERAELLEQRLFVDRRWLERVVHDLWVLRRQHQETSQRIAAIEARAPVHEHEILHLAMHRNRIEEL